MATGVEQVSTPQATPQTPTPAPIEREFTVKSRSQTQQALRRFLHNKLAVAALVVYVLMLLIAFVYPHFYGWTFTQQDSNSLSASPGTNGHPFGTDEIGQDLLARMMRGVQRSTYISVLFVLVAGTIGVAIGSIAGYFGKWVDNLLMRFVDVILSIPILVAILIIAANFPNSRSALGIALFIAFLGWMDLARIVRSSFLSLREREYVEAAHALGASNRRIIVKHLIPNSLGQIIVWGTLGAATAVITEAALSYLGYGVSGADTSLGSLVALGAQAAETRPWLFYFPGVALLIIVLSINLIGDGIRDAFDPSATRTR